MKPWHFDALALCGLALVGVGLWWIYPPLACIGVGAKLLFLGLWGAKVWSQRRSGRRS